MGMRWYICGLRPWTRSRMLRIIFMSGTMYALVIHTHDTACARLHCLAPTLRCTKVQTATLVWRSASKLGRPSAGLGRQAAGIRWIASINIQIRTTFQQDSQDKLPESGGWHRWVTQALGRQERRVLAGTRRFSVQFGKSYHRIRTHPTKLGQHRAQISISYQIRTTLHHIRRNLSHIRTYLLPLLFI